MSTTTEAPAANPHSDLPHAGPTPTPGPNARLAGLVRDAMDAAFGPYDCPKCVAERSAPAPATPAPEPVASVPPVTTITPTVGRIVLTFGPADGGEGWPRPAIVTGVTPAGPAQYIFATVFPKNGSPYPTSGFLYDAGRGPVDEWRFEWMPAQQQIAAERTELKVLAVQVESLRLLCAALVKAQPAPTPAAPAADGHFATSTGGFSPPVPTNDPPAADWLREALKPNPGCPCGNCPAAPDPAPTKTDGLLAAHLRAKAVARSAARAADDGNALALRLADEANAARDAFGAGVFAGAGVSEVERRVTSGDAMYRVLRYSGGSYSVTLVGTRADAPN